MTIDPTQRLRPGRKVNGISAVLLPFDDVGQVGLLFFNGARPANRRIRAPAGGQHGHRLRASA